MKKVKFAAGAFVALVAGLMLVTACDKQIGVLERTSVQPPIPPVVNIYDTTVVSYPGGRPEIDVIVKKNDTIIKTKKYPIDINRGIAWSHDTTVATNTQFAPTEEPVKVVATTSLGKAWVEKVNYEEFSSEIRKDFRKEDNYNFVINGVVTFKQPREVEFEGKTFKINKEWQYDAVMYLTASRPANNRTDVDNIHYHLYNYRFDMDGKTSIADHTFKITNSVVPPPADDELVGPGSSSGITNISPRQNNFWRKTWEIWRRPDGSTYNKGEVEIVVPFYNDITAPADKIVYVGKLPTKNEISAATSNQYNTVSNGNRTDKGITVNKFRGNFKLVNGSLYTLEWGMPYECPQGYNLAYTQPSWTVKSVDKLGNITEGGKTYERQMVTYLVTTSFNGQTLSSEGKVEMRKEAKEERETPSELGDPLYADYTRVQAKVGGMFIDMLAFVYQNGVVLMPEGNKAKRIIYAFDEATANKLGVERCLRISDDNHDIKNIGKAPKGAYSGYWNGAKWVPAKLTIQNEGKSNESWVYTTLGGKSHVVMRNEAVALENEAGVKKPAPAPQPQKSEVKEGKIFLYYSRGNRSDTRWDDTPQILK